MKLQSISPETNLNHIFTIHPEHVNNEYVYPAKIDQTPIYIDPRCDENKKIRDFLESELVTIVTPDMLKKSTKQDITDILQSCYENWRVLQASKKIVIDGTQYSILLKWIWSTAYTRETWAINPWMRGEYTHKEEEKQALRRFPFYESSGIYSQEKALLELKRSKTLDEMWIDCEQVLGIYKLRYVLWENGDYVSIQELEKKNIITPWKKPVILIRAHKTNFRLLDIVMLDEYNKNASILPLVQHILNESKKYWWTSNIDEYIQKLFTTVIQNRLKLIWSFSKINGEFWQDICRNISMFGEELDLWAMDQRKEKNTSINPNFYVERYNQNMRSIFIWLSQMVDAIEKNTQYKINHEQLAELIYNILIKWVISQEDEIKELHNSANWEKWCWFKNINESSISLVKSLFVFVRHYSHDSGYQQILKRKIEEKLKL